jgi:hypothetical protein
MNTPQLLLGQPPAPAPVLPLLPLVLLLRPLVLLRLLSGDHDEVPSDHDDVRNKKQMDYITVHICTSWLQACTQLKFHPYYIKHRSF